MIGTPSKVGVRVGRKVSDGSYGSHDRGYWVEVDVSPDANVEEVARHWEGVLEEMLNGKEATVLDAPVAHDEVPVFPPAPEMEPVEPMEVVKFSFERKKDGKYLLGLYEMFGDKVGQWPSLKFTAGQTEMWDMIGHVFGDYDFTSLPVEHECKVFADWKWGREKPKGEGRYKDLAGLRAR